MKNILFLLLLFCTGCSTDTVPIEPNESNHTNYFHMNVSGTELDFGEKNSLNSVKIVFNGDLITIGASFAFKDSSENLTQFFMDFNEKGNLLTVSQNSFSTEYGTIKYRNYINYPSNYFKINIISFDKVSKKIKGTFSGKLYSKESDLNSESVEINADFDMNYEDVDTSYPGITFGGIEQYCSAQFNSNLWTAKYEYDYGSFTAEDANKIDIHFAPNSTPGDFNFNTQSTDNYIKFSKFNTTTLQYDYYDVTGIVSYSYKEFHGSNNYSYIGTYSFKAINPKNTSEVIQVTNGSFRSYQKN